MSTSSPSPRDNAVVPTLFLLGVTALMVYFAVPQPYREGALPTAVPTTVAAAPTTAAAAMPTPEDHLTLMTLGLEEVPASTVRDGSRLYSTTCTACHGSDAKGVPGLGKTLVDSPFVNELNDDELVAFLHVGRAGTDPQNTTGIAMPAKGGNPSLDDDDLNAIVDYIRSLNGATVVQDASAEATPIPTLKAFEQIDLNVFGSAPTTVPAENVPAASATPQAPVVEATPVTSYGYETQGTATPETDSALTTATQAPSVIDPLMDLIPTSVYSYQTGPEATNVPVTYDYDTQATPAQP